MRKYYDHCDFINQLADKRKIIDFNSGWKYTDVSRDIPPVSDDFDDSDWKDVSLPHDYSIEHGFSSENKSGPSGGYVKTGVLWYRKKFKLDRTDPLQKVFLFFDGISMDSEIWLNGVMVKRHPYGYSPIHIDITPFLRDDASENCIAVKADTSLQPFSRFYQGTGIYRSVELVITSHVHFDDFGVVCNFNSDTNSLVVNSKVRVAKFPETVWNDFGDRENKRAVKQAYVRATLFDSNGILVSENQTAACQISEFSKDNRFTNELFVASPTLWSAESPNLYYMKAQLYVDDKLEDDTVIPVGLRSITYNPSKGFAINSQTVKLKGVCIHQDAGMFGCSVPVREWVRRIKNLKEMGVNAIRTSHHPFPKEFYDVCDLYGVYVLDEAFDEWNKGWSRDLSEMPYGKNLYGYHQYFDQWAETDLKLMVKRDRNHPCVVMWSMGNEIPDYYYQEGVDTLKKLVAFTKEEDNTRPVTIGAEGNYRLPIYEGIMENLDIAGYNYVNLKHPDYYDDIHKEHPEFVVLSSETFFEPQHWDYIKKNSFAIGQFLWAGFDYLGESGCSNPINDLSSDFTNTEEKIDPNFGGLGQAATKERLYHGWTSGMIDFIGHPKAQYYYHQSLWQEKPVIHVCSKMYDWAEKGLSWKLIPGADIWKFKEGELRTVFVFTNCPKAELYLNGELVASAQKNENDSLPLEFTIPYTSGELCAKGLSDDSDVLVSHSIKTWGDTVKLLLEHDFDPDDNRQEWMYLDIAAADQESNIVLTDKRNWSVSVEGAELWLLGNSGLYNLESYQSSESSLFNGRALAVLRINEKETEIKITVKAEGLPPQTLVLERN